MEGAAAGPEGQAAVLHPPPGRGAVRLRRPVGADGAEVTVRSATIITGAANDAMSAIHDRMPIILPPSEWSTWLSPEQHDIELLGKLLVPAPDRLITMHPVSTDVNNVRNKGEHLIDEVAPDPGALF